MLRTSLLPTDILESRINEIVQELKTIRFLEGTVFEERAINIGVEPYSVLLGILIGIGLTVILGLLTVEIWVPKAIARITGKTLAETSSALMEIFKS